MDGRILFVCLLLFQAVGSQSCSGSLDNYLQCLHRDVIDDRLAPNFENELDDSFVRLALSCFDQTRTNVQTRCVLSQEEMDKNVYGSDGPLKECDLCQKLAAELKRRLDAAKPQERKCLRDRLTQTIVDELEPEIQNLLKDPSFKIPSVPDFDQLSDRFKKEMEKMITHRINTWERLFVCGVFSANRADVTQKCLDKGPFYANHCATARKCKDDVISATCKSNFLAVENATCKAMNAKREEWQQKIQELQRGIEDSIALGDSAGKERCIQVVNDVVGRWKDKLQSALDACFEVRWVPSLNSMVNVGCARATRTTTDDSVKKELRIGFRFVRNFFNAWSERLTRFCTNC